MTDLTRFATNACLTAVALRNAIFGFDKTSLANNDECPTTKTFCALFACHSENLDTFTYTKKKGQPLFPV